MHNREGPKAGSQSSSVALQMLHVLVKERDGEVVSEAQVSTLSEVVIHLEMITWTYLGRSYQSTSF